MVDDPRVFYVEDCYALRGCLHCPDCLAFAVKFYKLAELPPSNKTGDPLKRKRTLAIKFILSTIASENLPCDYALSSANLKNYIDKVLNGDAGLPNCHYEFK